MEGVISDSDDDVIQFKKKPGKILLDFEEMDRKRKEEKCRRIENERRLKVESEMKRFRAEKVSNVLGPLTIYISNTIFTK